MRVSVKCVSVLLFAGVLTGSAAVRAEPLITQSIDYYDVTGRTLQEVRANLDALSPTSTRDGQHYDALTYPAITWRYTFRGLPTCAITGTTVTLKTVSRFPRLAGDAPASLKQAFAKYTDKLMQHKRAHADKAIEVARQIEIGIAGLPPIQSCKGLEHSADHLAHNLIKNFGRWRPHAARPHKGSEVSLTATKPARRGHPPFRHRY